MKVPLRFQVTEFDCGTTSLLNAISYLFEREEISAEIIKAIFVFTLDSHDKNGNLGHEGTSREAINKLTNWITEYSQIRNFKIKCKQLLKEQVTTEKFKECLNQNGVVVLRCYLDKVEHFVIMTDIDEVNVYLFDPYYFDETHFEKDEEVKIIFDEPFKYNRIVSIERLFSNTNKDFSIGSIDMRECVLIERYKD